MYDFNKEARRRETDARVENLREDQNGILYDLKYELDTCFGEHDAVEPCEIAELMRLIAKANTELEAAQMEIDDEISLFDGYDDAVADMKYDRMRDMELEAV